MAATDIKKKIEESLKAFSKGDLTDNCLRLFEAIGYNTARQAPLYIPDYATFKDSFINHQSKFNEDKALTKQWRYVDLLFQLSQEEISQQHGLFDSKAVVTSGDSKIAMESYLFFAIELSGSPYNRTALSQITRELNKLFPMPAMIFFKHGETVTLAIINRRLHRLDESKDVLEKVTLIKDISIHNPHRAHIEILFDLSFGELLKEYQFTNFVELHQAWQKTLDTKALNRRFYLELSNWYFWAMKQVAFPNDVEKDENIRNATNLIRLITRVIFIWFIREKGLVPDVIFNKAEVKTLLKDFNQNQASCAYYRAIMQNLFFGTLNQKIDERGFAKEGDFIQNRSEYGVKNLFRYADLFSVSEQDALGLFRDVPFLNGGLFDCLDQPADDGKILYVDGFSRNPKKQAVVPDFLFFADEHGIDLNEIYGTKNKKYKVKGLIEILASYKFTVTENTPIEEEVALDPELLGKVFENLLASYNPETQTTARKQTGSFYTPREIVNYMVDESLKAYLKGTLVDGSLMPEDDAQASLDLLFEYTERKHPFNETQTRALINAIDRCKILDPACGSGAFPMGVLHKMVHILHKLDPNNEQWKQRQIDKVDKLIEQARDIPDTATREQVIAGLEHNKSDIEDAFGSNELDYGRKLFLIENCIYGVDIQPIAVQIAKLRFFISLIIDQKKQPDKENFGIRALPNLETKFVAANTLIGLDKPQQLSLIKDGKIVELEKELLNLRHRYFSARTRRDKMRYQNQDKHIREQIAERLKINGWDAEIARAIVRFDPYDQNASAPFFDLELMFGLKEGFNITIGNPPYVRADSGEDHLKMRQQIINSRQYETIWEKWDLFIPFMERAYKLLKPSGITSLIVSDAYCHSKYAQKSQTWFLKNSRIARLDFLSRIKVFDAGVHNLTYFFQKVDGHHWKPERRVHDPEFGKVALLPTEEQIKLNYRIFFPEHGFNQSDGISKLTLDNICYVCVGMVVNSDERLASGAFEMKDLVVDVKDNDHPKPFVEGKHLERWIARTNKYLEWGTERAPALFRRPTFPEIYEVKEKLLVQRSPGPDPKCCYDSQCLHFTESSVGFIPWHTLAEVRNNSIKKTARYEDERPLRPDLPKREQLEETSRRFSVKYLLAVMNSSVARNFLRANRRSNIHLYPDDWKNLPIPDATTEQQLPIINLVNQILEVRRTDPSSDVSTLEAQVDNLVSALYAVDQHSETMDVPEITTVEGKTI